MNPIKKIIFNLKETKVVLVLGSDNEKTCQEIVQVLKSKLKAKILKNKKPGTLDLLLNNVLAFQTDLEDEKVYLELIELIKISRLPILILTRKDGLSDGVKEMVKAMPLHGLLVLNFDVAEARDIREQANTKSLTFGFEDGADLKASDVHVNGGINFKINFRGKTVPIWQEDITVKDHLYSTLAAICVGIASGLNLVEISESLKHSHR